MRMYTRLMAVTFGLLVALSAGSAVADAGVSTCIRAEQPIVFPGDVIGPLGLYARYADIHVEKIQRMMTELWKEKIGRNALTQCRLLDALVGQLAMDAPPPALDASAVRYDFIGLVAYKAYAEHVLKLDKDVGSGIPADECRVAFAKIAQGLGKADADTLKFLKGLDREIRDNLKVRLAN